MQKIALILRVYDRISDLEANLRIIKKYWTRNNYHIIIVANGKSNGILLPENIKEKAQLTLELNKNNGHILGNSQLLKEAILFIPDDCNYTIILEADTWLLSDKLIAEYINKMNDDIFWASAEWVEKYYSLALDFAIINTKKLKELGIEIFNYESKPECYVANYITKHNLKYIYINELMPTHRPNSMKLLYNAYTGRFRTFLKAPMLTHHIEDLQTGIEYKKQLANYLLNEDFFAVPKLKKINWLMFKYKMVQFLAKIAPRSKWYKTKKYYKFD